MFKLTATSSVIAAVATLKVRRATRPAERRAFRARAGSMAPPRREPRRPTSPAASLYWLSPATGTFAPAERRGIESRAS